MRGLGPGLPGALCRASWGATLSAPRRLGEGEPTPRASSRPHRRLQQHPSARAGAKACERRLPGSAAGSGERPEDTAGPRAGAQDALPGSAPPAAALGPALGPAPPPDAAPPPPPVPGPSAGAAVTQRAGNGCGEGLPVRPSRPPARPRRAPRAPFSGDGEEREDLSQALQASNDTCSRGRTEALGSIRISSISYYFQVLIYLPNIY